MKKWWALAATVVVLTGCGDGEDASESDNEVDVEETEEPTDTTVNEDTEDTEEVVEEEPDEDAEADNQEEDVQFVLQISDEAAGLSTETDEILGLLDDLMAESGTEEIGEEGEVRAQYSGLFLTDEQTVLYGVFILSNRSEEAMTNISMDLSVAADDLVLFEETQVYLDQEHFGVLEPNTAMPVYVEIDIAQLDTIEEISNNRDEITYVDNIVFDSPDENPAPRDPEGHIPGYRPEYMTMMAEGQDGTSQPEGNVPELEFVLPAYLEDEELSMGMIHVQDILDLAAAGSIENDISIYWTGVAEQQGSEENFEGVFLLMNRTGSDFKNIEFGFTLEDENGNVVFENQTITLPEEEFGVLRDGTMMPVYVSVPDEGEAAFMGIIEQYGAIYRFESWNAEED